MLKLDDLKVKLKIIVEQPDGDGDEKQNALQDAQIFYVRHMHPGVVRYQDEDILLKTDTIKKMSKTFNGKPIYVNHQDVTKARPEDAEGYVTDTFYNAMDGWGWSKIIVHGDQAKQKIAQGWSVSNAYKPTQSGKGGTFLNVDYNREILNAAYTHLAIVPDPRYEDSKIFTPAEFHAYQEEKKTQLDELRNNKTKGNAMSFMKTFLKKKEVELEGLDDLTVELHNGKQATIAEMREMVEEAETAEKRNAEAMEKAKKAKAKADDDEDEEDDVPPKKKKAKDAEKKNAVDLGAEITVSGTTMTVGELKQKYMTLCEKKNSKGGDGDEETETDEESDETQVETDAEKKNAKKAFDELQNAHLNKTFNVPVDTTMDQVARGQARYGSTKSAK